MNEALHGELRQSFPRGYVVCGDARALQTLTSHARAFGTRPVGAEVSSLGLLAMPESVQRDILAAAFEVLRSGGAFVQ